MRMIMILWISAILIISQIASANSEYLSITTDKPDIRIRYKAIRSVIDKHASDVSSRNRVYLLDDGGDNCLDAEEIVTLPYCDVGFTEERLNDMEPSCVTSTGGSDVFYKYTPEENQILSFSLCGTEFDCVLEIFSGCPMDGGSSVGCSDNDCDELSGCISGLHLSANTTYYIMIDSYDQSAGGGYELTVREGVHECPFRECDPVPTCDIYHPCEDLDEETEPNSVCPDGIDLNIISCQSEVTGVHCPADDHDIFLWEIPSGHVGEITTYGWEGCTTPGIHAFTFMDDACNQLGTGATTLQVANESPQPVIFYVDLDSGELGEYKISGTCCEIVDYCAAPLMMPDILFFQDTVSTCCATQVFTEMPTSDCSGDLRPSGRAIVYELDLAHKRIVDIYAEALEASLDEQLLVFTDCLDPLGSCIASKDIDVHSTGPESIEGLLLDSGSYFIGAAYWDSDDQCGAMAIEMNATIPPVSSLAITYDAAAGAVLHWLTPEDGIDYVFSTLNPNHDGDPDDGADADWLLETTLTVSAGEVQWTDAAAMSPYKYYAVIHGD